jgi:hypothetical protein
MKKLFTIAAVAMFSLAMVACGGSSNAEKNVDKGKKLVDQAYKALMAGDYEKVSDLEEEMDKLEKELTKEEKAELEKYAAEKFGEY